MNLNAVQLLFQAPQRPQNLPDVAKLDRVKRPDGALRQRPGAGKLGASQAEKAEGRADFAGQLRSKRENAPPAPSDATKAGRDSSDAAAKQSEKQVGRQSNEHDDSLTSNSEPNLKTEDRPEADAESLAAEGTSEADIALRVGSKELEKSAIDTRDLDVQALLTASSDNVQAQLDDSVSDLQGTDAHPQESSLKRLDQAAVSPDPLRLNGAVQTQFRVNTEIVEQSPRTPVRDLQAAVAQADALTSSRTEQAKHADPQAVGVSEKSIEDFKPVQSDQSLSTVHNEQVPEGHAEPARVHASAGERSEEAPAIDPLRSAPAVEPVSSSKPAFAQELNRANADKALPTAEQSAIKPSVSILQSNQSTLASDASTAEDATAPAPIKVTSKTEVRPVESTLPAGGPSEIDSRALVGATTPAAAGTVNAPGSGSSSIGPFERLHSMFERAQQPPPRTADPEAIRQFNLQVERGIAAAMNTQTGVVTLRLHPAALGQMRVQIGLERGTVSAKFEVGTARARDLLSRGMGSLREALSDKGVDVSDVHVSLAPTLPERDPALPSLPVPDRAGAELAEWTGGGGGYMDSKAGPGFASSGPDGMDEHPAGSSESTYGVNQVTFARSGDRLRVNALV